MNPNKGHNTSKSGSQKDHRSLTKTVVWKQ
jgi:hypothetical protein